MKQPRHILIADRQGAAIGEGIGARDPAPELRLVPPESLKQADLDGIDALITFSPAGSLDFTALPWVHSTGAGVDQLLAAHRFGPDTRLTRTTGHLGRQIAEYCLAHILADGQGLRARYTEQAARQWRRGAAPALIEGQRALIVGSGHIGTAIARLLAAAGIRVTGVARTPRQGEPFGEVIMWPRAVENLAAFRWLVLAAPLTAKTRGMIDRQALAGARGLVLINVARGALLDDAALLAALDDGRVASAILDVFSTEPLPSESPFWAHPRVTVTPHVSGLTLPEDAVEAFFAAMTGTTPAHEVDPGRGY